MEGRPDVHSRSRPSGNRCSTTNTATMHHNTTAQASSREEQT